VATASVPPPECANTGCSTSAVLTAPAASTAAAESAASALGTSRIRCLTSDRIPVNANGQSARYPASAQEGIGGLARLERASVQ
jgi:hypothetical protein